MVARVDDVASDRHTAMEVVIDHMKEDGHPGRADYGIDIPAGIGIKLNASST